MNFDTRTVMDIIQLDSELKDRLVETILEEQLFSENVGHFNTNAFIESITPLIKDHLKVFLKNQLNKMNLSVLKGTINLNNVDYTHVVNEVSKI